MSLPWILFSRQHCSHRKRGSSRPQLSSQLFPKPNQRRPPTLSYILYQIFPGVYQRFMSLDLISRKQRIAEDRALFSEHIGQQTIIRFNKVNNRVKFSCCIRVEMHRHLPENGKTLCNNEIHVGTLCPPFPHQLPFPPATCTARKRTNNELMAPLEEGEASICGRVVPFFCKLQKCMILLSAAHKTMLAV